MDIPAVVERISAELPGRVVPGRAEHERRYLKSALGHLGVPVPAIREIVRRATPRRMSRDDLLALSAGLWQRPVHEMRTAAIEVLVRHRDALEADDLPRCEQLIREARGWVYVDPLAVQIAGSLIERHPRLVPALDRWARDEDIWVRRSALLALLPGIRAGRPDLARLSRYGDTMLEEQEFFLRKALGWVLRELSKREPEWVRAWVAARTDRISGVAFREAVRHLPDTDREVLTVAYRAKVPSQ